MKAMAPIYLDTSALTKLVLEEPESRPLQTFLEDWPERLASALAGVEIGRAVLRAPGSGRQARALAIVGGLVLLALDRPTLERAAALPPAILRSLDAIHLASALAVPGLADMVVYDRRLAAAAEHHGLRVWSPGHEPSGTR